MTRERSEVQQSKTPSGSVFIPALNGISSSDVHSAKRPSEKPSISYGISIFFNDLQPQNIYGESVLRFLESLTDSNSVELQNRFAPAETTESGRDIFFTEQHENASSSIRSAPFGTIPVNSSDALSIPSTHFKSAEYNNPYFFTISSIQSILFPKPSIRKKDFI